MDPGLTSAVCTPTVRLVRSERKRRRESRRMPFRTPCRVTLYDPVTGEPTKLIGQTTNISRGGLSLHVTRDAAAGTWIEALVSQASGTPLFLCGVVAYSRRVLAGVYELGVEFAGPAPQSVF